MENEEKQITGAFVNSLKRTNKEIKDDRAESITEDAEVAFQRQVVDLEREIKRRNRERDNMLDLSPTNSMSLMVANEFDAQSFVERDNTMGLEIRNLEIKHEIAKKRYIHLFGGSK